MRTLHWLEQQKDKKRNMCTSTQIFHKINLVGKYSYKYMIDQKLYVHLNN